MPDHEYKSYRSEWLFSQGRHLYKHRAFRLSTTSTRTYTEKGRKMAATEDMEAQLMAKYAALKDQGTPLERLRAHTMAKGIKGIRTIGRTFRRMDENGDKRLQYHEFKEGLLAAGDVDVDEDMLDACFKEIDTAGDGVINFEEFLVALRPPLSEDRLALIETAFAKFDTTGDGTVSVEDLRGVYSAEFHPKFQSGEWTETQVFEHWLSQFTTDGSGQISKEDFITYYVGVSASIDDDEYFVTMMKQAWKLA